MVNFELVLVFSKAVAILKTMANSVYSSIGLQSRGPCVLRENELIRVFDTRPFMTFTSASQQTASPGVAAKYAIVRTGAEFRRDGDIRYITIFCGGAARLIADFQTDSPTSTLFPLFSSDGGRTVTNVSANPNDEFIGFSLSTIPSLSEEFQIDILVSEANLDDVYRPQVGAGSAASAGPAAGVVPVAPPVGGGPPSPLPAAPPGTKAVINQAGGPNQVKIEIKFTGNLQNLSPENINDLKDAYSTYFQVLGYNVIDVEVKQGSIIVEVTLETTESKEEIGKKITKSRINNARNMFPSLRGNTDIGDIESYTGESAKQQQPPNKKQRSAINSTQPLVVHSTAPATSSQTNGTVIVPVELTYEYEFMVVISITGKTAKKFSIPRALKGDKYKIIENQKLTETDMQNLFGLKGEATHSYRRIRGFTSDDEKVLESKINSLANTNIKILEREIRSTEKILKDFVLSENGSITRTSTPFKYEITGPASIETQLKAFKDFIVAQDSFPPLPAIEPPKSGDGAPPPPPPMPSGDGAPPPPPAKLLTGDNSDPKRNMIDVFAQIRSQDGQQLKPPKERDPEENNQTPTNLNTNDALMQNLSKTLQTRRKGTAGVANPEDVKYKITFKTLTVQQKLALKNSLGETVQKNLNTEENRSWYRSLSVVLNDELTNGEITVKFQPKNDDQIDRIKDTIKKTLEEIDIIEKVEEKDEWHDASDQMQE